MSNQEQLDQVKKYLSEKFSNYYADFLGMGADGTKFYLSKFECRSARETNERLDKSVQSTKSTLVNIGQLNATLDYGFYENQGALVVSGLDFTELLSSAEKESEAVNAFLTAREEATAKINEQRAIAAQAFDKMIAISEEYGIPFNSGMEFARNQYEPETYKTKWKELDVDLLDSLGAYGNEYGAGWAHSGSFC